MTKARISYILFISYLLIRSQGDEILKEDPLLMANLFEGDIAGVDIQTLNNVVNGTQFWSDKSIPYVIDNQTGYVAGRAIVKAITAIESKTCVRFRNATDVDHDYITFTPGKGCYSYVGKQGGNQEVSVGDGCEQVGTVLHLLMHVLGFWHEESRLDRDLYILINWDNIDTENAKHFEKYSIPRIDVQSAMDPSSSPYDYESITHISPYAYAKDKSVPSILTKDERFRIGQRFDLSPKDANAIIRAYCGKTQLQSAGRGGVTAADLMTVEQKQVYEKTVQQQTGQDSEQQQVEEVGSGGIGSGGEESGLINPEQPEGCRDTSRKCPLWATQGLCFKNPTVMAVKCAGSCQACQMVATCDNFNSLCGIWAWLGNCVGKSAQKYLAACPLACGVCVPEGTKIDNETAPSSPPSPPPPPATAGAAVVPLPLSTKPPTITTTTTTTCGDDKHRNCQKWSLKGRCFYKHVQRLCPRSCNASCDQPLPPPLMSKEGATDAANMPVRASGSTKRPTTTLATPIPVPPPVTGFCRDKRKNCARYVPKGHCQKPGFRKNCQLSCNLCENDFRARDAAVRMEDYHHLHRHHHPSLGEAEYCQDYSWSVCNGMQEDETRTRCIEQSYIRRLCPRKCRMCQIGGDNADDENITYNNDLQDETLQRT